MKKSTIFKNISYVVDKQSKWTFDIPSISKFVEARLGGKCLNVFAGKNSLNQCINNDFSEEFKQDYYLEALEFFKMYEDNSVDVVVLDPPYANHYMSLYKCTIKDYNKWYWEVKREAARVLKVGGLCIQIGYETNGIGAIKGFEKEDLLIVAHGGLLRDTFCYSERKVESGLHNLTWRGSNNG